MKLNIPTVPAVMTGVLGLFMVIAGFGTVLPGFVHDRIPQQFVPTWNWLLTRVMDSPSEDLVMLLAVASQWLIALTEWTIGIVMIAATVMPKKRLALTSFGVGLSIGLFGTFMLTMFAMHDKSLPAWNQFPANLAWLAATWLVVALTDGPQGHQNAQP